MTLENFLKLETPEAYDLKGEIMKFKPGTDTIDRYFGYKAVGELEKRTFDEGKEPDNSGYKPIIETFVNQVIDYVLIRKGEADTCPLMQEVYRTLWSEKVLHQCSDVKSICGDTMNSATTTLKVFAKKANRLIHCCDFANEETREAEREKLQKCEKFLKTCYTIGNMISIPKNRTYGAALDYWDLTLSGIYNHYAGNSDDFWDLEKVFGASWKECLPWLEAFGSWNQFVRRNYMQPFVEENKDKTFGKPKELWIGHLYTENAKKAKETRTPEEQFFDNASTWILERGELICNALKEEQK